MTPTIDEPFCPCCGNVATPIRRRDSITAMACEICGCRWDEQMRRPAPPADVAAAAEQMLFALDRAIAGLEATAERLSTPDDPYGGLLWGEDAEILTALRTKLRVK